jgi:cellulose biosynthesis protein BcsQ
MTTLDREPAIRIELQGDGSGQITIGGARDAIATPSLHAARQEVLARVWAQAHARNSPVRFVTTDPEGTWELVMSPSGQVDEHRQEDVGKDPVAEESGAASETAAAAVTSETATISAAPSPTPAVAKPATPAPVVPGPVAPGPAPVTPAPAAPTPVAATQERPRYDSGYVLDTIIPVTRIARSTRGLRSKLGLSPGRREREERADRGLICTPFGRPVTIVVADPRGGSGKTTTSLLLAGAFGVARGGGVLALENHELRGTMHLRTETHAASSTIRELLAAQAKAEITPETIRSGDLSRFVRHQVAGQYDVLVSATKTGRALRKDEFDQVHQLAARMYQVIIVDTANNESAENWQAAIEKADALLVPLKWRNDYSLPAIEMLEDLQEGGPAAAALVSRAVVVASHGEGDLDARCQAQLRPYFTQRTQAVIEIPPDRHIAEGNAIQHDMLTAATRRQSDRMAAEIAKAIRLKLTEDSDRARAGVERASP